MLISFLLFKKDVFKKKKLLFVILAALIFLFGLGHSFYSVREVSSAKKGITIFSDPTLVDKFNRLRGGYYTRNPILARIWFNKFSFFSRIAFVNYLKTFSLSFLFISGGEHPWHSIPNFGNFYLIEAVFIIFGLVSFVKLKGKIKWFLALWLLLSPLASAITVDAPHSTRSLSMVIPILVLISLGIVQLVNLFKKKKIKRLIYPLFFILYSLFLGYWLYSYFYVYPKKYPQSLMFGFKKALLLAHEKDETKKIITLNPPSSPYIYALFHLKINPDKFLKTVERYGAGVDNLEHVRSFTNFEFLYGLPEEKERAFYILKNKQEGFTLFFNEEFYKISL